MGSIEERVESPRNDDERIGELFWMDQQQQGFVSAEGALKLRGFDLTRATARGGFTIGQLVHKARANEWTALTFDDITGAPYRSLASRQEADTSTDLVPGFVMPTPLVSANMECVTWTRMAKTMALMGGMGVLHQFGVDKDQWKSAAWVKEQPVEKVSIDDRVYTPNLDSDGRLRVAGAIGVGDGNILRARGLVEHGVDALVVDIPHGHADRMVDTIKELKDLWPAMPVIAGNVVTPKGALALCDAGADVLKVGVGPGAACTTRLVTGYGIPQVTAIYETKIIAQAYGVRVLADGGMRASGDMVKALAAGADVVMVGRLLAGSDKSPYFDQRIAARDEEGKPTELLYYGSASSIAKQRQGRGGYDAPEGRQVTVPYSGSTELVLAKLITGIQSGLSYAGVSRDPGKDGHATIERLRTKSRWMRQSVSGIMEGTKGLQSFL